MLRSSNLAPVVWPLVLASGSALSAVLTSAETSIAISRHFEEHQGRGRISRDLVEVLKLTSLRARLRRIAYLGSPGLSAKWASRTSSMIS